MISFVAAMGKGREMGYKHGLPWKDMERDLARYKSLTKNRPVLTGASTYSGYGDIRESVGSDEVYVMTHRDISLPDAVVLRSVDDVRKVARNKDIIVIGGAAVFASLMPYADKMYLTLIDDKFEADTFFPEYDDSQWQEVRRKSFSADEHNPYPFTFLDLERIGRHA